MFFLFDRDLDPYTLKSDNELRTSTLWKVIVGQTDAQTDRLDRSCYHNRFAVVMACRCVVGNHLSFQLTWR